MEDLVIVGERRVAGHEEVEARRGDEGRDEADEVVVHVARVAQRGRRRRHDGRHQRVDLRERRRLDVQPVGGDAVQRRVVQHDDAVGAQRQPLQRQQRVVRLHHHVARLVQVREHAVRLQNNKQTQTPPESNQTTTINQVDDKQSRPSRS